jgi:hypothetical protein
MVDAGLGNDESLCLLWYKKLNWGLLDERNDDKLRKIIKFKFANWLHCPRSYPFH